MKHQPLSFYLRAYLLLLNSCREPERERGRENERAEGSFSCLRIYKLSNYYGFFVEFFLHNDFKLKNLLFETRTPLFGLFNKNGSGMHIYKY